MPSLQIKDYIIAGLLVIILGLGITIGYDKTRMSIMSEELTKVELLQKEQERKSKLIAKRTEQERKEANEQYESNITTLNVELNRLRDSGTSVLPKVTKSTRNPELISFYREKLDRALREHEQEIQSLVGEGRKCQIELNTVRDWWYNVQSLYE